ncbi:MAG: HNH endonuclease [Proteobacteria bacterium]|nr:HNH endonuclease [Pseudomonadota bacterium]
MDDRSVRQAAFEWLNEQTDLYGYSLERTLLAKGFEFQGERIPLVAPQGIFKPRCIDLPLSITTVAGGPYADSFRPDGLLSYRYRGTDPRHRDNVGLRECMRRSKPLIYFHGIKPGSYVPSWPVFIVGDDERLLTFTVAVDDALEIQNLDTVRPDASVRTDSSIRRGYVTRLARQRIHQQAFRERVLSAYREQCALCRLKHGALLDAAHIVPDSDPEGEPVTSNGVSMCKLHHAAFDRHFLAIDPDYKVVIRPDILEESDGPMLKHGLQGLHRQPIVLPSRPDHKPDKRFLKLRYEKFMDQGKLLNDPN